MADSIKISGFIVLFTGVAVLLFTFYIAYQFLIGVLNISGSEDLMGLFGDVLAPLIMYAIRALYLGIMGWIGSILTRRGVQIITSMPKESKAEKVKAPTKAEGEKEAKEAKEATEEVKETKEPEKAESIK